MNLSPMAHREITHIVIHHAATPPGRDVTAEEIHHWHRERGFDGIGYHYAVLIDGTVEQGRPEYWTGAHVEDQNTGKIGICVIGTGKPEGGQEVGLRVLVGHLLARYPEAEVCGHRNLDPTSECPGFDAKEWWRDVGPS